MKLSAKTISIILLGALTITGLVLICVFSANNFAEASRLQKASDAIGDAEILNIAYTVRYVALLRFLWFCLTVIVAWGLADVLFIHTEKRTIKNVVFYGVVTLLAVGIGVAFALLQGNIGVMKYAYVYMLISIAVLLVLTYVGPVVLSKIPKGVSKGNGASTN